MELTNQYQYNTELNETIENLVLALNSELPILKFLEQFTLSDLSTNAVSNLTDYQLELRLTDPDYFSTIKVIESQWDTHDDTFTVFFNITPTKGSTTTVLTPSAKEYPGSFYNVAFQFQAASQYLGSAEEFNSKSKSDQLAMLKLLVWKSAAKLHSNDPSFYYQGMWEDLYKLDGTIYKFPGPKGEGVWRKRHAMSGGLAIPEIRITKHMAQVINQIDSLLAEVRDSLRVI